MNLISDKFSGLGTIQTDYLKNKIWTEVIEPYVLYTFL